MTWEEFKKLYPTRTNITGVKIDGKELSEEEKQELIDLMNRMNEQQQTTPADDSADKNKE
jgi:hypothetical protein